MTHKLVAAFLTTTLAASPAFAGSLSLKLGSIKALRGFSQERLSNTAVVPSFRGSAVTPVKFKREVGPGAVNPNAAPPNLNAQHFTKLAEGLHLVEGDSLGGDEVLHQLGSSMPASEMRRLLSRMGQLDKTAVDPIDAAKWNTILDNMIEAAKKNFDAGKSNWPEVVDLMLKEAYGGLRDPFSVFMNPKESAQMIKSSVGGGYSGIGAQLSPNPLGITLDMIFPNSPAEVAGLKEGDVVTHVNGISMEGKTTGDAVSRIVGLSGTTVTLTIKRGVQKSKDYLVTRGTITRPNVFSENFGNGMGYVFWAGFNGGTDAVVLGKIDELKSQGVTKLVLDVRGNPGGSVGVVAEIASEFLLDNQEILTFRRQGKIATTFSTDGDGRFKDMEVVLLVNGNSFSASEILALTFKDLKRGAIVGSTTGGKGTAQSVMAGRQITLIPTPLGVQQVATPTGRIGKVTSERWHGPSGGSIDGDRDPKTGNIVKGTGGVVPTVEVKVSEQEERALMKQLYRKMYGGKLKGPVVTDTALEKAKEILGADLG
ncbi:MAG: hypothetical protein COB53_08000 [Elusimicrobia bacterium]|nr:MAG: hypothetical protein COB53_08000 [Elusimicrobiota bacterium]